MGLNIYYTIMAFWGIYQWKKDADKLKDTQSESASGNTVHLTRLTTRTVVISSIVVVVGVFALIALLRQLGGNETVVDAIVTVLSAVAMFWLGKSYPQHWILWILSDTLLVTLCVSQGLYWMTALYIAYVISAIVGLIHWRKNGKYVEE